MTTTETTIRGVRSIVAVDDIKAVFLGGDLQSSSTAGVPMPAIMKWSDTDRWA